MRVVPLTVLVLAGCVSTSASQGGAQFKSTGPVSLGLPPTSLFDVCWPPDAPREARVVLTFEGDDVRFETKDGASNGTARCMREIATAVRWSPTLSSFEVAPPEQPIDGWAVMEWVHLLASSRYDEKRGVLAPGPLVAACGAPRESTRFVLRHSPGPELRVLPSALTDAERCIEGVLSAVAWPSSRELFFDFSRAHAPAAGGEVSLYRAPDSASSGSAIDPQPVKEALSLKAPAVSACWEEALARRTSIGGGRTFRFRVDDQGTVTHAWVAATISDGPTAADLFLDRCLERVIRSARFPPAKGDGFYTWVFAQR